LGLNALLVSLLPLPDSVDVVDGQGIRHFSRSSAASTSGSFLAESLVG
jgi:hypothetical protein